jgi:NADH-quinone oxidoreductase subunit E
MLSESEIREIDETVRQYPYREAACLDALKIVQQHRGWVSDEAITEISEKLSMSEAEVEGVATFYSRIYRKPVGRNVILLCDGMSCMVMGYKSLYDFISDKLGIEWGGSTPDGKFTLLPISCLGDCDHAPSMMINDELFNNMTPEGIDEILIKFG